MKRTSKYRNTVTYAQVLPRIIRDSFVEDLCSSLLSGTREGPTAKKITGKRRRKVLELTSLRVCSRLLCHPEFKRDLLSAEKAKELCFIFVEAFFNTLDIVNASEVVEGEATKMSNLEDIVF